MYVGALGNVVELRARIQQEKTILMSQFLLSRQSILALAVSQALLFSSVQAFAADEDQVSAKDGEEVTVSDRKVETTGDGVQGMYAAKGGKIQSADMAVATSGKDAYGVLVRGQGSTFQSRGELEIETSGDGATGLRVGVSAIADVEKVTVVTSGNDAAGIYAFSDGVIKLGGASVTTTGDNSVGILGWQLSTVEGTNLQVRTEGYRSAGVAGQSGAFIDLKGSSIVTEGDESVGAGVASGASIELSQGTTIVTRGRESHGAFASGSSSLVKLTDSFIETFGAGAAGVKVEHGGRVELVNTHVKANGAGAVGAQLNGGTLSVKGGSIQSVDAAALSISGRDNNIDIDGAFIGSTNGPAIKVESGAEAKITVSNGSTLSSNNGKGELLDLQSDSELDLEVDGSILHGNLTIPEGALVNVRLKNGTRFTGHMSDVEALQLDKDVTWEVNGDSNVGSLVLAGGRVDFSNAESFHRLSMGELSGNGTFGLKLDMNARQVDFLDIKGQATGDHWLSIQNSGAEPEPGFDPLQVVHTEGGDALFNVVGERVDMGAFSYGLERLGDDWFLTGKDRAVSPATHSVQALFNSAPTVWYGEMSTLRSRMGEVRGSGQGGVWMRSYGNKFQVAGSGGLGYQQNQTGVSFGVDTPLSSADGSLLVGLLGGYSKSDLSQSRGSSGTVESFYVGGYGTWAGADGYYVDAVLKLNQLRNRADVVMSDFSKAKGDYRNYGLGASVEAGRQLQLSQHLYVEPFTQLSAVAVKGKAFTLDSGLRAENSATRSLLGKVGVTLEHRNEVFSPYIKVALAQEFARDNVVKVNGHRFNNDLHGTRGEVGVGAAMTLARNLQVHADFEYMKGQSIEQPWGANLGLRYAFD